MRSHAYGPALAATLLFANYAPATAKTIEVPINVSIQKGELSIARLRLAWGPKLRKDVCAKAGSELRAGNTVRVTIYGAGKQVITVFTYTKRDCQ